MCIIFESMTKGLSFTKQLRYMYPKYNTILQIFSQTFSIALLKFALD